MISRPLLLIIFFFFVISSVLVSYFDSQKVKNLSEEEYVEAVLQQLGYPPYSAAGHTFKPVAGAVYLPVRNFYENQTVNPFGVYRSNRFLGYHSGVDVEVDSGDINRKVPVYSIFEGEVKEVELANGYGGVVAVKHSFGDIDLIGIYGHVRLWDVKAKVGQKIGAGAVIGYLGADYSSETDGERKHLHFGLSRQEKVDIRGYVEGLDELKKDWINPSEFLRQLGAKVVE
ncbi:MAG: M23 family metallopeptidase [Minisyncoccia bacterium]